MVINIKLEIGCFSKKEKRKKLKIGHDILKNILSKN